ncbi:MAG: hypothetical protein V4733_05390 [Verrucomicrobiota bacterium]
MKFHVTLLCLTLPLNCVSGETLTDADREALLEKLTVLQDTADEKVDARYRTALAAYRQAMGSGPTAIELYLKCVEKLNFTDQGKKESEFRDWKRKSEWLKDPAFGAALCHQLRWLTIMIRASSEKADIPQIRSEAKAAMDAVFANAADLRGQFKLLSENAGGSVFARTYDLSLTPKDLAGSPLQIDQLFDRFFMPPLRNSESTQALRSAWMRRIQLERIKAEWTIPEKNESAFGKPARSPEAGKFDADILPDLRWAMEKDIFQAGDERGAGLRMMELIESNTAHKSVRRWTEELRTLVTPKPEPPQPAE